MALLSVRLGHKVTMKFVRNFNMRGLSDGISNRAKNDLIKVSLPARMELGLKGKWHELRDVINKIVSYQEDYGIMPDFMETKKLSRKPDMICNSLTGGIIGYGLLGYIRGQITLSNFLIFSIASTVLIKGCKLLLSGMDLIPFNYSKKEIDLYNYLLKLNHKEPVDLKKEMKKPIY